jgi:hypothetical protein
MMKSVDGLNGDLKGLSEKGLFHDLRREKFATDFDL